MSVLDLVRPEVRGLRAYETTNAARDVIRLDNNELPWPAPGIEGNLNRYPAQPPRMLQERMAAYYGVAGERILPTRGSDDALDALFRCFCRPGHDAVLTTPPTFGMYRLFAELNSVAVREAPLGESFQLTDEAFRGDDQVRVVFLCSPNNPTGKAIDPLKIVEACKTYAGRAIVVVDEAYGEFMSQVSAASLLDENENLVVLRTLSKALGVAGARVGALLASREIVACVRRVLPPYLLPTSSVEIAEQVLSHGALEVARRRVNAIVRAREHVAERLRGMPQVKRVYPSDANFLLVAFEDARGVQASLCKAGIMVRAFADARLAACLRIGIGSESENRRLLAVLEGEG